MTQTIELAVIPGDGIGKEVVPEGLKVLAAALEGTGVEVATTDFDLGADRWHRTGETLTDADLEAIKGHDAILLGAVGDPSVPSGVLERGLLLRLRFALDHYVNLRPRPWPIRARSTSWSCARAPRACTAATGEWCARARPTRSPPR